MHRGTHAVIATVLVLASQAGDGGCEPVGTPGYDCHVRARGLTNENGLVVDVLTHWCDPVPQEQTFTAWIVARPGPGRGMEQVGRSAIQFVPAGPRGKTLRVEGGRCQADVEYATAWESEGTNARGVRFTASSGGDLYWTAGLC